MSPIIKKTFFTVVWLFGLCATAYVALWVILIMAMAGTWPFEPLEQRSEQMELANGDRIAIEGVEDRGFGSDGFLFDATYISEGGKNREKIAAWIGHAWKPEAHSPGDLVVLVNPDLKRMHVRSPAGMWKTFFMSFPGSDKDLSRFVTATTLSEQSLAKLQQDLTDEEKLYSPNAYIDSFDPEHLELKVRVLTTPDITRVLVLGLTNDGSTLTLSSMTKVVADHSPQVD